MCFGSKKPSQPKPLAVPTLAIPPQPITQNSVPTTQSGADIANAQQAQQQKTRRSQFQINLSIPSSASSGANSGGGSGTGAATR